MSFLVEDRGNGITWVQVDRQMYQIAKWCRETGCGKQVNFKQISFRNEAELTMFLMRWNHDSSLR